MTENLVAIWQNLHEEILILATGFVLGTLYGAVVTFKIQRRGWE